MEGDFKHNLKALFERRHGRNNPISRHELHRIFPDISDRKLRMVIHELRREDMPILFATRKPTGYYIPANFVEQEMGLKTLRSYIVDLCITRRALKRGSARYLEGDKQPHLL